MDMTTISIVIIIALPFIEIDIILALVDLRHATSLADFGKTAAVTRHYGLGRVW